jgi:DNA primase
MTEREINEQIILRLDIAKNVKHHSVMGHCPFHTDKHPSFSIDIDRALCHCFSCGYNGTLRRLFREITGHSINKELGIKYEAQDESTFINPFKETIKEDLSATPDVHIALDGAFIPVDKDPDVCKYLMQRCIPVSVAKSMRMQFATMARSFDTFEPNNKDQMVYFNRRLVIPIYEKGKLLSCEGRDIYGKDYYYNALKRKGMNPDEHEYKKCIYPRGASTSTLYDIDKLDSSKRLYFVEGIMDLAVLRSDNFFNTKNSTAVFGASISERQKYFLKQFDFTYIIDADLAGWLSLRRLMESLKEAPIKRDWKFVVPPFQELGVKDVGDIPVKTGKTIEQCRKAHWLDSSKDILANEKLINDTVALLQEEKKKCEQTQA